MKHLSRLVLAALVLLSFSQLSGLRFARWSTSMGVFTAELYDQLVPITANNFISLSNSGFYNGLIFHRVINGFVIQDGCPYGTGYGGPGYTIPDEFHPDLHHDQAGILAMARTSAPNSAGSQYYITLAPQPHLDGNYAIFGKVIQGLDVVLAIGAVPTDANNLPLIPVTIDTLRILDLSIGNITPDPAQILQAEVNEPLMFIVEAEAQNSPLEFRWYADEVLQAGAADFIYETSFPSAGWHEVKCVVSSADWAHELVWGIEVEGTAVSDPAVPSFSRMTIAPNPFSHELSIRLDGRAIHSCQVSVYDLKGRAVRMNLPVSRAGSGWIWDGCDASGNRLPTGIYIIRASDGIRSLTERCLLF